MKYVFVLAFVFFSLGVFSQSRKEIKVAKNKIAEAKTISDIIAEIPKDCKIISFVFSVNINGSLKEFTCIGDGMSSVVKSIISYKEKGQWFFIENIKSGCAKSHKPSYKIIVD